MNDELRVRPGFAGQSVLIISPFDEDHVRLGRVLGDCGCQAHAVRSCRQGLAVLRQQFVSIVICERDLPDGTWKDILQAMDMLCNRPSLIVVSRLADDYLWVEVLSLGGHDVLPKPLDHREVVRAIDTAKRNWSRERNQGKQVMKARNTALE